MVRAVTPLAVGLLVASALVVSLSIGSGAVAPGAAPGIDVAPDDPVYLGTTAGS